MGGASSQCCGSKHKSAMNKCCGLIYKSKIKENEYKPTKYTLTNRFLVLIKLQKHLDTQASCKMSSYVH